MKKTAYNKRLVTYKGLCSYKEAGRLFVFEEHSIKGDTLSITILLIGKRNYN